MVTRGPTKLEGLVVDDVPWDPPMSAKRSRIISRRYEARHSVPAMTKGKGRATALEIPCESRAVEPPAQVKLVLSVFDDDDLETLLLGLFAAVQQPTAGEASSSSAKFKKLGPNVEDDRSVGMRTSSRAPTESNPEAPEEPETKASAGKRKAGASI